VLDTQVPTVFLLPPRTCVGLLRPEERRRLCGGVPVGVGGLGILCTQFVHVGGAAEGVRSDVMAWFAFDKADDT
jgi:hypothetical protein